MICRNAASVAIPVTLACISCVSKRVATSPQPFAGASFYKAADDFLRKKIADPALRSRIRYDTVEQHSANMVLFRVENRLGLRDRNMILVHVNADFSVDTVFTRIDEPAIRRHIADPEHNFLYLSREGAIRLARQKGFEEGVKPWNIHLVCYAGRRNKVRWSVTNTLSVSSGPVYRAKGKALGIDIDTCEVEERLWEAVE